MDYRTVWRWHFYAGLFSIPFIIVLSITGAIYLFKPQVEQWLDAPYDHLTFTAAKPPSAEVQAALAAMPGARFLKYELPPAPQAAARVILMAPGGPVRVYVDPADAHVLKAVPESARFMQIVRTIHGELLAGTWGSALVELAASWAIVMILTGLYLWWPRKAGGLAGLVYPRLHAGGRMFWRDLHAVTGLWISILALFLLISGLPWASVWGGLLQDVRTFANGKPVYPDWTVGGAVRPPGPPEQAAASEHAHHHHGAEAASRPALDLAALDRVAAAARPLRLAAPVTISPPRGGRAWQVQSDTQNRPLRETVLIEPDTGTVVQRSPFGQRPLLDRIIGIGVAAHEGQLFGWINQLLGVVTALGLIIVSVSGTVMWWRRRPQGILGAPPVLRPRRATLALWGAVILLGVLLPMFGLSLILILLIEWQVLRRIAGVRRWLGLRGAHTDGISLSS